MKAARVWILFLGLSSAWFGAALTAMAAETIAAQFDFNISAQPVELALLEFSEQADVQVMVGNVSLAGQMTKGVKGRLDVASALQALLRDTGLTADTSGRIVTIVAVGSSVSDANELRTLGQQMQVAQAANIAAEDSQSAQQQSGTSKVSDPATAPTEVIVTGSRLFQKAGDAGASPITVIDSRKIASTGTTTIADVLNYVPQQTFSVNEQNNFGASRVARLRGLGVGNTLVLINGRRTVTSALLGSGNVFDLNTVPLSAVDRIEVLSDSASAIYGTDAIGGVVNIILKDAIEQPQLDLYAGMADGGGDERRASLAFGRANTALKFGASFEYFHRSFLLGTERDAYANQDFRSIGGKDFRFPYSNPGTVFSTSAANLPGLPSNKAAVPAGSTGVGLLPSNFLATAGQENSSSFYSYGSILPSARRYSGTFAGSWQAAASTEVFGELLYSKRDDVRLNPPALLASRLVPASNAFNPFGVAVNVNYLVTGAGPQTDKFDSEMLRAVAGVRGSLGNWTWEGSVLASDDNAGYEQRNNVDSARLTAALASNDPAAALNVFQDGPGGSAALLQSLLAAPVLRKYHSEATQGSGLVRGSALQLPAGELQVAGGFEIRRESLRFNNGLIVQSRSDKAVYAETYIPIVNGLTATAAIRMDDYSDFGKTVNPQFGLVWKVSHPLSLRASYGTSFRAPSLFELYNPRSTRVGAVSDPRRGNTPASTTIVSGGNPVLQPEDAKSFSTGFVFTPAFDPELQLSLTYWSIRQDRRLVGLAGVTLLANEGVFPDRVVRSAPTLADTALGWPGALVSIDTSSVNFGRLKTSGWDFKFVDTFKTPAGDLSPELSVTRVNRFSSVDLPTTPEVDRVGVANFTQGTIAKWRGTAGVTWAAGPLTTAAYGRYVSSYADITTLGVRNGLTVPSTTYVDLQFRLDLDGAFSGIDSFKDFSLSVGGSNIFDRGPGYSEVNGSGIDYSLADTRQRFLYLSVSKKF